MNRPSYSPFQGGLLKKIVKVVFLAAFIYATIDAIALGRKNSVTAATFFLSLSVLAIISLIEHRQHWRDLSKCSAEQREQNAQRGASNGLHKLDGD